jgi:monoamine oxidase
MEGGAYNPYPSSAPGQMSRMERDLSISPHNVGAYMNGGCTATMFRQIQNRKPHVCIVGAGISGLRCAAILARKGLKVTILEARDRVGGRVCISGGGPNFGKLIQDRFIKTIH